MMRGIWWLHPEHTVHRYVFPVLIVSLLLVGGVLLAATMIHHWSLLILLSALWLITAIAVPLLLFNEMAGKIEGAIPASHMGEAASDPMEHQTRHAEPIEQSERGGYTQYMPSLQSMSPVTTLPPETVPTVVAMQSSPETPMPMAPLVRVLETIDLSTSGVEHFLDTSFEYHSLPVSSQGAVNGMEPGVERVEIPKSERDMTFG